MYKYEESIMNKEMSNKKSLKEMTAGLKTQHSVISFLNSEINIALLGEEIFNKKVSENFFDINRVSKEERFLVKVQDLYLEALLKASTPNFKIDNNTFNFNRKEKIGWVVLEFNKEDNLSNSENIEYTNAYIDATIHMEPTLIFIQEKIVYVAFFFPNYPTTDDEIRLRKYRYFKDVRKALTHTLDANWSVDKEDYYNETTSYKNIYDSEFKLYGNIFEIGSFQEMLDEYKQSSICKKIIKTKLAYGGYKSGITKRNKSEEERQKMVEAANEKKIHMSKHRLKETVIHILDTQVNQKLTIDNIVRTSKKIFDRGLGHKTVAKYLNEIKSDLDIK